MILYGNEPDFPVDGIGTCATCKREDVEIRKVKGRTFCADLTRCAMAVVGVDDDLLRAPMPAGEIWIVEAPSSGHDNSALPAT